MLIIMSSVLIVAAVCCTVALWWLICSFLFYPEHCLCQNKGTESPVQRKTSIEKSLVLPAINHLNQKGQRLFEASLLPSARSTSSFISPPVRAAPLNAASIVFECKCVFLHPFLAAKRYLYSPQTRVSSILFHLKEMISVCVCFDMKTCIPWISR